MISDGLFLFVKTVFVITEFAFLFYINILKLFSDGLYQWSHVDVIIEIYNLSNYKKLLQNKDGLLNKIPYLVVLCFNTHHILCFMALQ